jgi:hypothetical protein
MSYAFLHTARSHLLLPARLNTVSLSVSAQDSHGSGDTVSGNSPATQERPPENSAGHSRVDPSSMAALTQTVSALFGPPLAEAIRSTRDRVYPTRIKLSSKCQCGLEKINLCPQTVT